MQTKKVTVSLITPTYNRAELLVRCYESLKLQSDKDFEWIIIDDGSTDETTEIVKTFQDSFRIVYHRQENGGKHRALNAAHPYVTGEYVGLLDSDDQLTPDAVYSIKKGWKRYDSNPEVGMVTFLKGENEKKPSCMAHPKDEGKIVDIMRYKRICFHSVDAFEIIRTELFLKYPFPEFDGEKFISEGALWNRISRTHKCVYINKVIYIAEYQEDGLTRSGKKLRVHNPCGGMFTAQLNMSRKNYFKRRIKNALLFTCYGFFAAYTPGEILAESEYKILTVIAMLPGYVLFIYWKRKYY